MHPAVASIIHELKRGGKPYLFAGNSLACGRVSFAVSPSVEADKLDFIRLDLPNNVIPEDAAFWGLFFVALFGAEKFCELLPRMKVVLHQEHEFSETVDDWNLRLFWEDGHRVLLAQARSLSSAQQSRSNTAPAT